MSIYTKAKVIIEGLKEQQAMTDDSSDRVIEVFLDQLAAVEQAAIAVTRINVESGVAIDAACGSNEEFQSALTDLHESLNP